MTFPSTRVTDSRTVTTDKSPPVFYFTLKPFRPSSTGPKHEKPVTTGVHPPNRPGLVKNRDYGGGVSPGGTG